MGNFATLVSASAKCPECGRLTENDWQFYYGELTDLPWYSIGDWLVWFGDRPSYDECYAVCYPTREFACSHCKNHFLGMIYIIHNRLMGVEFYSYENWVGETVLGIDRKPISYGE